MSSWWSGWKMDSPAEVEKLFNCSAWEETIGKWCKKLTDSENAYKKQSKGRTLFCFCFECFLFNSRRNDPALYRNPEGSVIEHDEVSWELSKMPIDLYEMEIPPKTLPGTSNVENRCKWDPVGSAFGLIYLPELLYKVVDNQIQQLKIVKDHEIWLFFQALQLLSKVFGSFIWYHSLGILWVRFPTQE